MASSTDRSTGHLNQGWTYTDRIQRGAEGVSVLEFYTERYPHSSPQIWLQRIEAGLVSIDGRQTRSDEELQTGQLLTYHRPPWHEDEVPTHFQILHEDEHLIAVAKPSGLPTIPGGEFLENTLLFLVRQRYPDRPAPIHRLGRGTSGIVIFARSQIARRQLSADLRTGKLRKTYRALATGAPAENRFTVEAPIGQVPYPPLGRVHAVSPDGKPSRTECRILERRPNAVLLEVDIHTGRAHQIRIHLAAAGHPLVGDPLYRIGGLPTDPPPIGRAPLPGDCGYHLHAQRVRFVHPADSKATTIICLPPRILQTTCELG
ncbi:MAG: RluA family pseudouridine synthase [Gemmatimonadetes bacterium]|jgi:23S rRNA pseudouridine1911/1915/1917 synthase|nr:RluA family pseudouridine synthase [Gemmatimonadota bacterium]